MRVNCADSVGECMCFLCINV